MSTCYRGLCLNRYTENVNIGTALRQYPEEPLGLILAFQVEVVLANDALGIPRLQGGFAH